MKRYISMLLAVVLLLSCVVAISPEIHAAQKVTEKKAIAIVYDNSGSMYVSNNLAWCRATYAMEVFASMLGQGDELYIYPMNECTIDGQTYKMDKPFKITDPLDASKIRGNYIEGDGGTPIESIDSTAKGLKAVSADKKYMIVLTDGTEFHKGVNKMSEAETKTELEKRITEYAGPDMTVMYLGIGSGACMPEINNPDYFVSKKAANSANILSSLTEMCNLIFGRDALSDKWKSTKSVKFDISMKELIVFVQGENIGDLQLVGPNAGTPVRTQQLQYSTAGCGRWAPCASDTELQGMMVTYEGLSAGEYTLSYSGTATSVEAYYEPDADLDFVFTDANGNTVDPNALYEGDYKVSFGMKDAQTGELINSELLGNPHYQGSYYIKGVEKPIVCDGSSGFVDVPLCMNDTFDANLTVTYLSGYTIRKDSSDFGWPEGGIKVAARPAGDLRLEIAGGQEEFSLQNLEEGKPYTVKVYYQGTQLTGGELENAVLSWDSNATNAELRQEFADDHYILSLHYKNPDVPQDTVCGECTVPLSVVYAAPGSSEAQAQGTFTYDIKDDFSPLQIDLQAPQTYIVIKELEASQAIVVNLKMNGAALSAEEFAAVELQVDCGGIAHTVTPSEQDSSYVIKLLPTDGIAEGNYPVKVTAQYTDHIGRTTQVDDSVKITLSNMPLWMRWVISLLFLLLLAIILWVILHIRVLPKYMHTTKKLSSLNFDGDDVTQSTNFLTEVKKGTARAQSQYAGRKFGISMDVKPGSESYLYKPQKRRSAEVNVLSVRKFGPAKIQEVMIGSAKYVFDEEKGKLVPALANQKPFPLTHGMMVKYSGTIQDAGVDKDFEVTSKLDFKKK